MIKLKKALRFMG